MKKSIIYLGIALVTFTNVISALAQQSFVKEDSLVQTSTSNTSLDRNISGNHSIETRKRNLCGDPEAVVITTYQKTMEEIIAENNQIIESTISSEEYVEKNIAEDNQIEISIEVSPVSNDEAIKERILQDLQIIDGSILNDIQPTTLGKSKKS